MKNRLIQTLSITLAAALQLMPLLRTLMPATQGLAPSAWAMILKIGVGSLALVGFDAVSRASSISISPANATAGTPYVGTVSYSGGHAGSVSSMSVSNTCLGSAFSLGNGLSIVYAGANLATVTGTPTTAGTLNITMKMFDSGGCGGGGNTDTRSTTLVIGAAGGGNVAPAISATPQNVVAQVGTDVQLSGGASGNPIPQYQWWTGVGTPIAGATNSILTLTNVQLTNSGVYTMTASNSSEVGATFFTLPKANCYLSVCISGGTNFTAYNYTNFAPAGMPLTIYSYLTNVATATSFYSWYLQPSGTAISSSNTLSLSAAQLTPAKSGTYTVRFDSTNATSGYIVTNQQYYSYWAFGYQPNFTNQLPAATNINAGSNVTLTLPLQGTLDVYNPGSGGAITTNGKPCVFWYKNTNTLVASQIYTNYPTSLTTYTSSVVTVSLTLSNLTSADAGNYTVVATNFWGSTTSSPLVLTVNSSGSGPGVSLEPPATLGLLVGQSSTISVTATGSPALFYQWRKTGLGNLSNGGVYSGVNTNVLTLTSIGTNNAGSYSVVITNSISSVTSSVTALTVSLPPSASLAAIGSTSAVLGATTLPGLTYVVEQANNLSGAAWKPILTNVVPISGVVLYTNSTAGSNAFYRLRFP